MVIGMEGVVNPILGRVTRSDVDSCTSDAGTSVVTSTLPVVVDVTASEVINGDSVVVLPPERWVEGIGVDPVAFVVVVHVSPTVVLTVTFTSTNVLFSSDPLPSIEDMSSSVLA